MALTPYVNIPNKVADEYLKFVQQHFNTSDINFMDIIRDLDNYSKNPGVVAQQAKAEELRDRLKQIKILIDLDKYDKFDKLGNFGLSSKGLRETYQVSDDIIKDIRKARQWIDSYKAFRDYIDKLPTYDPHEELIMLGKSILGRAIELTPMDTGTLRRSGTLYDFGTYIIIAFTAPYASYVHENLNIRHPQHRGNPDCGGKAKFLEDALQEFFPDKEVWVEQHGESDVAVKIGINPLLIEYRHYD